MQTLAIQNETFKERLCLKSYVQTKNGSKQIY